MPYFRVAPSINYLINGIAAILADVLCRPSLPEPHCTAKLSDDKRSETVTIPVDK